MGPSNVNFKLLSLNVRGIRTFEKRKAIFIWRWHLFFLQEIYSTRDVESIWKNQWSKWRGNLFFSHGTCYSKGVLVLVKNNLDFNLQTVKTDPEARYIMLDAIHTGFALFTLQISVASKFNFFKISQKKFRLWQQNAIHLLLLEAT